jgi:plastocyanin
MKRALLLIGIALLVAGCGGGKKAVTPGPTTTGSAGGGATQTKLEMDNFYFSPKTITGKPGQKITLELKNEGSVEHNLTVASQGINRDVEAGKTATVEVTIPQSGTVAFYCKYHKSRGMTGQLQASSGGY